MDSRNPDSKPFSVEEFVDTYRQCEELYREGKIRAIGISNMTVSKLQAVLPHLKVMPAAMEMELHPAFQQKELLRLMGQSISLEEKSDRVNDESVDRVNDRVNDGIAKTVLDTIALRPGVRTNEIATHIGKSVPTVSRYIKTLKDSGKIEFRGASKKGVNKKCKVHLCREGRVVDAPVWRRGALDTGGGRQIRQPLKTRKPASRGTEG